ncbi:hypothetical protein EDB80DRAFT_687046 [Ilyonectria destructans]|nr:hypothetical protein EDB80DRAFT_687046 [Ilyonectria destructans]
MKASFALSALSMAVIAIAAPADIVARDGSGSSCSSGTVKNGQKFCCNGGLLGLNCILASTCDGDSYCCNNPQMVTQKTRTVSSTLDSTVSNCFKGVMNARLGSCRLGEEWQAVGTLGNLTEGYLGIYILL